MISITRTEVFTFLLFSSCFGTNYGLDEEDNLIADVETETGDVPPWMIITQRIEMKLRMFERTLLLLDATINSNTQVLTAVKEHLEEAIAKPCCCSQDQNSSAPAVSGQAQKDVLDGNGFNKTVMVPGIEVVKVEATQELSSEPKSLGKTQELPNQPKWSNLKLAIRSLLTTLKKNYTFTGRLEKYDKEIFGN